MRTRLAVGLTIVALTFAGVTGARADGKWLHIRVEAREDGGENVRINLPLQMIEGLLPLIQVNDDGDVQMEGGRIRFDIEDLEDLDIPALLTVIKDAQEGEYITVEEGDHHVRVAKEKGDLLIHVDEPDEQVNVRLRMNLVEALTQNDGELDLVAMVQALREHGEGELVSVDSPEETVRIWVDSKNE